MTNNGRRVEALRDTEVSVTLIRCHLVSEEQVVPRAFHQVVDVDNSECQCKAAQVLFEWGSLRSLESGCEPYHACRVSAR